MNVSDLKVTLVQMPRWEIRTPPFAIALLTSILRGRGFTVFPKDYDIDFYRAVAPSDRWAWTGENPVDWGNPAAFNEVLKRYDHLFDRTVDDILADAPDVVGFSVKVWSLEFSREVAKRLKQRNPDLFIVFGGPEMNKGPDDNLVGHPYVDAICRQEGDVSFPSFLETYVANGGKPGPEAGFAYRDENGEIVDCGIIPGPPAVSEIPFADYSDFDFEKYTEPDLVNLVLSRGCIYRCTFCSEAPAFLKFRSYAAQRILAEVDHVVATTNIRKPYRVHFNDSLLNGDLKALEGLAEGLLEREEPPFQWGGMMALRKQMTDELVHKISAAGCKSIFVGMESGSPKIIRLMKKGHDVASTMRLTKSMYEAGIDVTVSIVCGYPGEGEKEFYETLDVLRLIAPHVSGVMLHMLSLSTGSIMTDKPEKFGVDVTTIHGAESWDWVADEGANTPELRLNRVATLQHMLRGKVIDYGGPLDRREGRYDPYEVLAEKKAEDDANFQAMVRNLRIDRIEPPPANGVGVIDRCAEVDGGARLGMSGWARHPLAPAPAKNIVVIDGNGQVLEHVFVALPRSDVARAVGNRTTVGFGWELIADAERLRASPQPIRVCAYDASMNKAFPLEGTDRVSAVLDPSAARG
jgi:radical SAM superfamily enzyme YgiQ (UPF0313 family)